MTSNHRSKINISIIKGSGLISNSFWLLLFTQFATVQDVLALPVASQPPQPNNLASHHAQPSLLVQRKNRPVLRRTKIKPVTSIERHK